MTGKAAPITKPASRTSLVLYVLTAALTAAGGLVVEIVAGRILAPFLGMSLYTWTAVIAVVLAGFSAGHWIGGGLADRAPSDARRAVAWTLLLAAISTLASLILLRIASGPILSLGLPPVATIIALTTTLFFLPSFFIGVPAPILTKLAIDTNPENIGRVLGLMYAAGAIGSILGTLAAGYIFIGWLGSTITLLMVAGTYTVLGMIFFFGKTGNRAQALVVPFIVGVSAATVLTAAGVKVQAFRSNCMSESDYYCIRIVDISAEVGTDARLMVLDHLGHGMNIKSAPQTFLSSYIELTDLLVRQHLGKRDRLSAFFIGGGAYTLPRAWAARMPKSKLVVAEIDPQVTLLARRQMWLKTGGAIVSRHLDARRALQLDERGSYDVVIGDAFHDIAVPPHLVTGEFFALVRARLANAGVFVMTVVDQAPAPRFLLSLVMTLRRSFANVEIWLDDAQSAGRATFIVLAAAQETPASTLHSPVNPQRTWQRWRKARVAEQTAKLAPLILSDDYAPVARLLSAHAPSAHAPSAQ